MQKAYYIIASNGTEIIDARPDAEIHYENEMYMGERHNREQKKLAKQLKKNKHPFAKVLANAMGLL